MKPHFALTALVLMLAVGSIGAQETNSTTKKKTTDKGGSEHKQSSPPPQQSAPEVEHRQAAPVQQSPAPAVEHRQSTPPPAQGTPPVQQKQPVYTPQDRPSQRPVTPPAQNQQQPGRTFGNPQNNRPPNVQNNTTTPRGPDRPIDRGGFGNSRPPVNQVPQRVYQTPNGGMVRRNDAGRVMEVRTPSGAMIRHEPSGVRRVEVVRPDGRVIVTSAGGHGYVQRQVIINNTTIVKRT
jgi:hypothetical protein